MDVSFCRIAFPPHPSPPSSGGSKSSCWGAKRGSGGCSPSWCAGGRVPADGSGGEVPQKLRC